VKILWTETALHHLDEVPAAPAAQVLARLEAASRHPEMYPARQRGAFRGYRWFPAGSWLVFYETAESALIVRGILHGARKKA
jgi:plasmid stabilization system protein ParE